MARIKEEFKVLYPWRDLEDVNQNHPRGREYRTGDLYPAIFLDLSEERIEELEGDQNKIGRPLIERLEGDEDGRDRT